MSHFACLNFSGVNGCQLNQLVISRECHIFLTSRSRKGVRTAAAGMWLHPDDFKDSTLEVQAIWLY